MSQLRTWKPRAIHPRGAGHIDAVESPWPRFRAALIPTPCLRHGRPTTALRVHSELPVPQVPACRGAPAARSR